MIQIGMLKQGQIPQIPPVGNSPVNYERRRSYDFPSQPYQKHKQQFQATEFRRGGELPIYIMANNLKPFISEELEAVVSKAAGPCST